VIISAPGGSYVVTPGGRAGADPLPAARVASPPVAGRPTHPPHAAWRTPSPRQLTGLIRGTP